MGSPTRFATAATLTLALFLGACDKPGVPVSAPGEVPQSTRPGVAASGANVKNTAAVTAVSRLAVVLDPDLLGVTPAFFDKKAGEPERATEDENTYNIDGCTVVAHLKGQSVQSIELLLSPTCHADLSRLGQGPKFLVSDQLTFGQFQAIAGPAQFKSTCLYMCGNAYDPTDDAVIPGFHANNFMDIVAVTMTAYEAREKWRQPMMASKGEDYVVNTKFNCDREFDPVARKAFADEKVESLRFGHGLDEYSCE